MQRAIYFLSQRKKLCIVHGNCQTEIIQRCLAETPNFISEYTIIDIPRVCQENEKTWENIQRSSLMSYCDLFIYQHVSNSNKYGSERASERFLKK